MGGSLKIAIIFKNLTGEWQPSQAKKEKMFTFLKPLKCNPCQCYCDVFMMLPKLNTLALYVREGWYVWGMALPPCWNMWTSVALTPFLEKTRFSLQLFWCIFCRSVAHTKTVTHCEMWLRLGFQHRRCCRIWAPNWGRLWKDSWLDSANLSPFGVEIIANSFGGPDKWPMIPQR